MPRTTDRCQHALARAAISPRRERNPPAEKPVMMNSDGSPNGRPVTIYGTADVPADALVGEAVAVLGYGYLGRTAALNLRDSGIKVAVGNREDEYAERARADGFEVVSIAAAAEADVVFVLLPDETIPEVFAREIAPALRPGSAVAFASGYSVAFGLVAPPDTVDVLLIAPRMAGVTARERYLAGDGFWACVGVEADRSGRARRRMLGLAEALGALRVGAIEMRAAEEATLDLFIEQTVGPLLGTAIMVAFEVGQEAGLAPETLAMEMYMSGEMETVFGRFRESGFFRASEEHGPTAVFGGLIRTLELDRAAMTTHFRAVLQDIESGAFARRFQDEASNGYPVLDMARAMMRGASPMSKAEDRLRRLAAAARAGRPTRNLAY
jgi:ketol-acid reductoisomerase